MASKLWLPFYLVICTNVVIADVPPRLTRDGVSDIWGFPGVSYKAVNYIPVCGTLSLSNPDEYTYFTTVATCDSSMSTYDQTTATSALYDYTGTPSNVQIGTGTPVCLCFSLGGALGQMDMCVNILGDGTPEGRWSVSLDDIIGGTFVSNANKALPQCNTVNVPSISSSVYAQLQTTDSSRIANPTPAPAPTTLDTVIVTTIGTQVHTFTALVAMPSSIPANISTADPGDDNKSNRIALGLGLGIVSIARSWIYRR